MTIVTVRTFDGMNPKRASRRQAEPSAQVAEWTRLDNKQLRAWHEPVRIAGQCPPWTWEYPGGGGAGTGGSGGSSGGGGAAPVPQGVFNYGSFSCNYALVPARTASDLPAGIAAILVTDTLADTANGGVPKVKFEYVNEAGGVVDTIVTSFQSRGTLRVFDTAPFIFVAGANKTSGDWNTVLLRLNKLTKQIEIAYESSFWDTSSLPFLLGASDRYLVIPELYEVPGEDDVSNVMLTYTGGFTIDSIYYASRDVGHLTYYIIFDLQTAQVVSGSARIATTGMAINSFTVTDSGEVWVQASSGYGIARLTATTPPSQPTVPYMINYVDAIEANTPFGSATTFRSADQVNHYNGKTLVWGRAATASEGTKYYVAEINESTNALSNFNWGVLDRSYSSKTAHPAYWNGKVYFVVFTDGQTKVKVQGYNLTTRALDFLGEIPLGSPAVFSAAEGAYTLVVSPSGVAYVNYQTGSINHGGWLEDLWTTVPVQLG